MQRGLGRSGVAALEFGLLAPILAAITVGLIEGFMLVRASYLVEFATDRVVSTIGQQNNSPVLTPTVLQDMCKGARLALRAFDNGTLQMAVVSSTNDPSPTSTSNPAPKGKRIVFEYDGSCATAAPALGLTPIAISLIPNGGDNTVEVKLMLTYKPMFPSMFPNRTLSAALQHNPKLPGDTLRCETAPNVSC